MTIPDAGARTEKQDLSHAGDNANEDSLSFVDMLQQMAIQMKKVDHDMLNILIWITF
jgi:hypothetical protein